MADVPSFVEAMRTVGVRNFDVKAFLVDRDERFREGNDKTWGRGNWVRCMRSSCTDALGYPAYHHKEAHA